PRNGRRSTFRLSRCRICFQCRLHRKQNVPRQPSGGLANLKPAFKSVGSSCCPHRYSTLLRIWFIIDEFPIFQKLQALDSLITEGRKYGAWRPPSPPKSSPTRRDLQKSCLPNHSRKLAPPASSLPNTIPKQLKKSPVPSEKSKSKSTKRGSSTAPTKSETVSTFLIRFRETNNLLTTKEKRFCQVCPLYNRQDSTNIGVIVPNIMSLSLAG
nr:hypothetical protein [Chlamydiota bacterium]